MKTSHISKQQIQKGEEVKAQDIREGILNLIKSEHPDFNLDSYITLAELNQYRRLYLTSLITQEKGELAIIDRDVMDAIKNNSILSENIQDGIEAELEIKLLSEKIDHLLVHQNRKLLEIQEIQTDYLEDLMKELKKK